LSASFSAWGWVIGQLGVQGHTTLVGQVRPGQLLVQHAGGARFAVARLFQGFRVRHGQWAGGTATGVEREKYQVISTINNRAHRPMME